MFKLLSQRGALAFLLAGFMNAFVDLGHKIIIQNLFFVNDFRNYSTKA